MPEAERTVKLFSVEKTYKSYQPEQGAAYARGRSRYHPKFYQLIIDKHTSTGGKLENVLDVGCGPGTATHDLVPHFAQVIGMDASEGMINTARALFSPSSAPIRFEVSGAEELGSNLSPPISNSSIDLITAATAAHWFDLPRFWRRAAQVLKPGGSVALWAASGLQIHPSMPNSAAIETTINEIKKQYLSQYREPGSLLAANLYAELPLPWTLDEPIPEFDESTFYREEWGKDRLAGTEPDQYGQGPQAVSLDDYEKLLDTASVVTRWRQANPSAVGTENDVVKIIRRKLEQLLHEAGFEAGKEEIVGYKNTVLLVVKKKG